MLVHLGADPNVVDQVSLIFVLAVVAAAAAAAVALKFLLLASFSFRLLDPSLGSMRARCYCMSAILLLSWKRHRRILIYFFPLV